MGRFLKFAKGIHGWHKAYENMLDIMSLGKCKLRLQWTHYRLSRMASMETTDHTWCWQGCSQNRYVISGNTKWYNHFGKCHILLKS